MQRTSLTPAHLLAFLLIMVCAGIRMARHSSDIDVFNSIGLPDADHALVEFLLLLPLAALVVCVFRNVVGLSTFGTFAPALLGLAFRGVPTIVGSGVLLGILLFGWILRRGVNHLHLLQVPRTAFMLSLVVCLILGFVVVSNAHGLSMAHSLPLLPLVILTGMIERFWSMEEEEGTSASLQTLLNTLGIASLILILVRIPELRQELLGHPGIVGIYHGSTIAGGAIYGLSAHRTLSLPVFIEVLSPKADAARNHVRVGRVEALRGPPQPPSRSGGPRKASTRPTGLLAKRANRTNKDPKTRFGPTDSYS